MNITDNYYYNYSSVVTKAVDAETETKTEAAGFETEAKTETVASETEAKTEAVYLKTEAEAQGSWPILLTVLCRGGSSPKILGGIAPPQLLHHSFSILRNLKIRSLYRPTFEIYHYGCQYCNGLTPETCRNCY